MDEGGNLLSICRSPWHSTLKNTKTEDDVDAPGLVPIIKPLRLLLDAIKPAHVSGFIFPNIIGGAPDLDNLFARVIRPTLKADNLMWKDVFTFSCLKMHWIGGKIAVVPRALL